MFAKSNNSFPSVLLVIRFSQVFGLSPIGVSKVDVTNSKRATCYSIFLATLFTALSVMVLVIVFPDISGDKQISWFTFCVCFITAFSVLADYVVCLKYRKKYALMLRSILALENVLTKTVTERLSLICIIIPEILFCIFCLVCCLSIDMYYSENPKESLSSALQILGIFLISVLTLQFVSTVYLIGRLFYYLNERISTTDTCTGVGCLRLESGLSLSECYDAVCEVARVADTLYSVPMLLQVALNFFFSVGSSYVGLLTLVASKSIRTNAMTLSSFLWAFLHVVLMLAVTYVGERTTEQARNTAVVVQSVTLQTKNKLVKEKLQLFALQLMHHKVQFTACGLFPLDFTLLYSVVGAMSMYLMIMLQFQVAFASGCSTCNANT